MKKIPMLAAVCLLAILSLLLAAPAWATDGCKHTLAVRKHSPVRPYGASAPCNMPHRIPYETLVVLPRIICMVTVDTSPVDGSAVITPVNAAQIIPDSAIYHATYLDDVRFSGWFGLVGSRVIHCDFFDAPTRELTYDGFLYCQVMNCGVCDEAPQLTFAKKNHIF